MTYKLSNRQFTVLKYFLNGRPDSVAIRFNGNTLSSLIKRGLIARHKGKVFLTREGIETYQAYNSQNPLHMRVRKQTWDDFERAQRILRAIQRLRSARRVA